MPIQGNADLIQKQKKGYKELVDAVKIGNAGSLMRFQDENALLRAAFEDQNIAILANIETLVTASRDNIETLLMAFEEGIRSLVQKKEPKEASPPLLPASSPSVNSPSRRRSMSPVTSSPWNAGSTVSRH
jgi:hypothetical protein